ncbi:MAG: hypothetical protein Q9162_007576 [Coniocarpon cinnabarinum]
MGTEHPQGAPEAPKKLPAILHQDVRKQRQYDIALLIGAVRTLSLLLTWTFFQPDEYYQSLEPGWEMAFGRGSGAWITWEWDHQLRSSLHPLLIATVYHLANAINFIFAFPLSMQARVLIWAPRLLHGFATGTHDFYTWRLAEKLFGEQSVESSAVLAVHLLSPWLFFAGTRSFTNGLEASLTAEALSHWPWQWYDKNATAEERRQAAERLHQSIIVAAFAVILRSTNGLIWLVLTTSLVLSASQDELIHFLQRLSVFGMIPVVVSTALDRLYYGEWTIPAARFLGINVVENLSEFYGRNRLDYYITEGLPLLLTTVLPFALVGICRAATGSAQALTSEHPAEQDRADPQKATTSQSVWDNTNAMRSLALTALVVIAAFSCIVHKEVRFLSPLFPIFAVLSARPICRFFGSGSSLAPETRPKQLIGIAIAILNACLAAYICTIHQRGVIDVMNYLRGQFYALNTDALIFGMRAAGPTSALGIIGTYGSRMFGNQVAQQSEPLHSLSVGFLMPCHSTPWRSHLVHPEIKGWALTCEPPIGLSGAAREHYLDEADQFYADPRRWLAENMGPVPSIDKPWIDEGWDVRDAPVNSTKAPTTNAFAGKGSRPWPRYVVFFEQLERVMHDVVGGARSRYRECWRGFNSHWHDDWRRKGDVVVWCVDGSLDEGKMIEELERQQEL